MHIEISDDFLLPLIHTVVKEVLHERANDEGQLNGRLAYTEAEAANLLGIQRHTLRDCRLRGEIAGAKIGKRIIYGKDELLSFLRRQQQEARQ